MAGCKCAYVTDEFHGWGCYVTGGACEFLNPNSKLCAEIYDEGPDAVHVNECNGECAVCPENGWCVYAFDEN